MFSHQYFVRNIDTVLEKVTQLPCLSQCYRIVKWKANTERRPLFINYMFFVPLQSDGDLCYGCGDLITERFLLHVNGQAWHVGCLRCCICQIGLERQTSCFIREDNIYCRNDYSRYLMIIWWWSITIYDVKVHGGCDWSTGDFYSS